MHTCCRERWAARACSHTVICTQSHGHLHAVPRSFACSHTVICMQSHSHLHAVTRSFACSHTVICLQPHCHLHAVTRSFACRSLRHCAPRDGPLTLCCLTVCACVYVCVCVRACVRVCVALAGDGSASRVCLLNPLPTVAHEHAVARRQGGQLVQHLRARAVHMSASFCAHDREIF